MNYLPLASGGVLLFTMITLTKFKLDSILALFAVLPLIACISFFNTVRSHIIPPLAVRSNEHPYEVLPVLRLLQTAVACNCTIQLHNSLGTIVEKTRASILAASGFVVEHLRVCRHTNCPMLNALVTCRAFDLLSRLDTTLLRNVAFRYITDMYATMIQW